MLSGAQTIIKRLIAHNVSTVFGYPGGAIMPIYDALYESGVRHILCRHEQGAALSALGYARASGKIGVCMATSGPGATNLITGLSDALFDSIPIIAITGQVSLSAIGTDAFQEIDILGMSLACTKHSFIVEKRECLAEIIDQAFQIALSDRPGPVLIDIPKNIQQEKTNYFPSLNTIPEFKSENTNNDYPAARQLIEASQKPILYIGGGVACANAVNEVRKLIKITNIPSVTTLKGIGSIPPETPHFLGMLGMHGTKSANLAVQESDLLIAIGARFDDRVTGKINSFAPNAKILHLDIDPAEINKVRKANISLQGDLKTLIPNIHTNSNIQPWRQSCLKLKQKHQWQYDHPGQKIYAPSFLKKLSEKLPKESVLSCDVGQHQMWVAQHMSFSHPRNHLSSSGLGTMGFGLPAAIGAQISRPNDLSILVSGDGSFMMNVQELATIKRYQLAVKIIILDNQRLGLVRQWQEIFFEKRFSETDLSDNPNFVLMANSFDIQGQKITRKDQINTALDQMLNYKGAYLLHVSISETDNVWPLVPPGASNSDMMEVEKCTHRP